MHKYFVLTENHVTHWNKCATFNVKKTLNIAIDNKVRKATGRPGEALTHWRYGKLEERWLIAMGGAFMFYLHTVDLKKSISK